MENISEINYLQNLVNSIKLTGLSIHEKGTQDKRKTVKYYFLQLGNSTLSPCLDYENMNHFLLGFFKAKKLFQTEPEQTENFYDLKN